MSRDGRDIDPALGELSGEGAHQRVKEPGPLHPVQPLVGERPSQAGPSAPHPSYYGLSPLKQPVWVWSIPLYFYVGGLAGAASLLGVAADFAGRGRLERLVRRCHWIGAVGDAVSGALLVHDLGRPERFLNMLRVFRVLSPMSMGSWVLSGSAAANGAAVLLSHRPGLLGKAGRAASVVGGVLGVPLAGYTAVLLTNTSAPLWQHTHRTLPLLFMSSAVASCGAFLELLPQEGRERRVARAYGLGGAVGQLAATVAVEKEAAQSPEVVRPLKRGLPGALWTAAKVCTAAGLGLSLLPGRQRWKGRAAAVLTTAGALAMRFAFFYAGRVGTRDPQATFRAQRAGLGGAQVGLPSEVLRKSPPDRFPLPVLR